MGIHCGFETMVGPDRQPVGCHDGLGRQSLDRLHESVSEAIDGELAERLQSQADRGPEAPAAPIPG